MAREKLEVLIEIKQGIEAAIPRARAEGMKTVEHLLEAALDETEALIEREGGRHLLRMGKPFFGDDVPV